jgi:hypothetical protein
MRYVCEFSGEIDILLVRDLADSIEELEDCLDSGIRDLGDLIRCYPISDGDLSPQLGLIRRDVFSRSFNR